MRAIHLIAKLQDLIKLTGNADVVIGDDLSDFNLAYIIRDKKIVLEKTATDPNH